MAEGKFISYLRVSTERQGRSGLGLDAQRKAVSDFLNGGNWSLIAEVVEVESGKRADRPKLAEALRLCRLHGARLVIAKLDRLSRDAHFLLGLQKADVEFIACDMPHANKLTVGIMALVAEQEREAISARTREALAAAKARGVRLGGFRGRAGTAADCERARAALSARAQSFANDLRPMVAELQGAGLSLRQIAAQITSRGILSPRGKPWTAASISRVLTRAHAG